MTNQRENSRERFKRVAEKRVKRALREIRLVGNLGNTRNYSYEDLEVVQIFDAIKIAVQQAQNKFDSKSAQDFKLQ